MDSPRIPQQAVFWGMNVHKFPRASANDKCTDIEHYLQDYRMKKSSMTILLATMMAVSGFAAAQTADVKSGTQGGAGPNGMSGSGDNGASVKSRAEVKAERMPQKSGINGGEGANPDANPNTMKSGSMAPKMTTEQRKERRAKARAARKARLAGTANNPGMKEGKSTN